MPLLRKVLDLLIFSSFFIAGCAVLMAHQTALLFHLPLPATFYVYVFSGTVCSYNFHWAFTPANTAQEGDVRFTSTLNRYAHAVLGVVALAAAVVAAFFLMEYWLWLGLSAGLAFLYSAPKIPYPFFTALQRIAVGKTIFLAMAWAFVTALLPVAVSNKSFSSEAILFFANRFFFIYAICIIFDRRDRESDIAAGIKSLVTYLNPPAIERLFYSSIATTIATGILLATSFGSLHTIILLLPCVPLAFLYRPSLKTGSNYFYYLLLDGLMALSAPLLILATFAR